MSDQPQKEANQIVEPAKRTCFIIMPISDHPDYLEGHFGRVYDYIIKPACARAGFLPDRADDAQQTHVIMMNILQRILDADMVLCDLSSKNPNVLYELGIRQAFDKPVTLIKDDRTTRIFDTGMLSDVEYGAELRIDNVQQVIETIAVRLRNTFENKDKQVNSLIQLLKIQPAKMPPLTNISTETTVILDAITTLGQRISALETPALSRKPRKEVTPSEYYAPTKHFEIKLRSATDEEAQACISLFNTYYPIASSQVINKGDELVLRFKFDDIIIIHLQTVDRIIARLGLHATSVGIQWLD